MSSVKVATLYAPVASGMAGTERVLKELLSSESAAVTALCDHVGTYSGKRLRPALVHLCGGLVGRTTEEHAAIGAVIEALHLSSLLHDDVLDEADTRRRVPTLNALHGNEIPILLGDLLYSRAFTVTLGLSTPHASRELAHASEAICRGEIDQGFLRFDLDAGEDPYFAVIRDKTATLYGTACSLGARYAGGTEAEVRQLRQFGFDLGMAFQIIDDCLDVIGDEGLVGKSLGTDLETGKVTLPALRLSRRLAAEDRARFKALLTGAGEPGAGSRRERLRAAFDFDAVVAECQQEANTYITRCQAALAPFKDGPEKDSLLGICSFVLARGY
ncbi:MAG: polyprenyl synthetase family protein [Planctomycetota bacterium]